MPPQTMTCLFSSVGPRIGNSMTLTFTFLILADWNENYNYLLAAGFACQCNSTITSLFLPSGDLQITSPLPLPVLVLPNPDPPILACFVFRFSLFFCGGFPFFSKDFRVPRRRKPPCFLRGFPGIFQKAARVGGSVELSQRRHKGT